jgi:hypothetical protein
VGSYILVIVGSYILVIVGSYFLVIVGNYVLVIVGSYILVIVRSEVMTEATLAATVFWCVTPCSLVKTLRLEAESEGSSFLPNYTASRPRIISS